MLYPGELTPGSVPMTTRSSLAPRGHRRDPRVAVWRLITKKGGCGRAGGAELAVTPRASWFSWFANQLADWEIACLSGEPRWRSPRPLTPTPHWWWEMGLGCLKASKGSPWALVSSPAVSSPYNEEAGRNDPERTSWPVYHVLGRWKGDDGYLTLSLREAFHRM